MIQKIIEMVETEYGIFYLLDTNRLCISFSFEMIDIETSSGADLKSQFDFLLKNLSEDICYKFTSSQKQINEQKGIFSRNSSVAKIGYSEFNNYIHFEFKMKSFLKNTKTTFFSFINKKCISISDEVIFDFCDKLNLSLFKNLFPCFKPVDQGTIYSFYPDRKIPIQISGNCALIDNKYVGVIKLNKLGNYPISYLNLPIRREMFTSSYQITTTIVRMKNMSQRLLFSRRKKQETGLDSMTSNEKVVANDEALAGIENRGDAYYSIEQHIVISQSSEAELMIQMKHIHKQLFECGEYIIESKIGIIPCFLATLPGSESHQISQIFELDYKVANYLPVFTRGSNSDYEDINHRSSFAFHRNDLSIDFFDPFSKVNTNSMFNIIGRAGKGKSVFVNLMVRSFSNDPCSRIIIVDVRGSHLKTVMDLGGHVHHINLDTPSTVNPFKYLNLVSTEEGVEIIRTFVSELLLDEDEKYLPTKECYYLDEALIAYSNSKPQKPSIKDFIIFVYPNQNQTLFPHFPRKEHLLRFSSTGVNKNIFSSKESSINDRIQYFNIDEVMQASNKTIAKATMAAIMAEFSFQLLTKRSDEKLFFVADEVPFFIEHCFSSFSLLSKNVRKLRGSLGLVVQTSNNLIVNEDRSLINNAETNIFFSNDGNPKEFSENFQLSEAEIELISKLRTEIGQYSQFYIKNSANGKVGYLMITEEEYWQTTTHPSDLALIDRLRECFPNMPQHKISKMISNIFEGELNV